MSNYTKATNFATKDALPTGNALKIVSGTEIDTEFSNIETAVNTKADTSVMNAADALKANIASPTFTGVPAAPTATAGTNTTQVATTAFAKAAADAAAATVVSGKVLQVKSFAFTGDSSTTVQDNTFADSGLTIDITPTSATSKILVMASIGKIGSVTAGTMYNLRIVRGTTNILLGVAAGARTLASAGGATTLTGEGHSVTMNYLDSPATTSATTYKVTYSGNGGEVVSINYTRNDDNSDAPSARVASTITVMEIGA